MEYRYPRWGAYALLVLPLAFVVAGGYGFATESAGRSSMGGTLFVETLLAGATVLCLYWCLYLSRHSIRLDDDAMVVTEPFRVRSIPFSRIAQVVTTTTPRGGTDSLLLDKDDDVLGKLDGSLIGFDSLLANLGTKLSGYQATFYRRGISGPWGMQVAGDTHWVPSDPPRFARTSGRRQGFILVVGFLLIATFLAAATWLEHGGLDKLLGH